MSAPLYYISKPESELEPLPSWANLALLALLGMDLPDAPDVCAMFCVRATEASDWSVPDPRTYNRSAAWTVVANIVTNSEDPTATQSAVADLVHWYLFVDAVREAWSYTSADSLDTPTLADHLMLGIELGVYSSAANTYMDKDSFAALLQHYAALVVAKEIIQDALHITADQHVPLFLYSTSLSTLEA